MSTMQGHHILVLGLGESGLAMATWCASRGAHVRVWDSRENPPQAQALLLAAPEAQRISELVLGDTTRVLKSPGLSPKDPKIASLLQAAQEQGIPVHGELDLFVQALAQLKAERDYVPKLIAITGTNGKTTTTALTALLVERCGKQVALAGNIGPSLLDTLSQALSAVDDEGQSAPLPEVWVLELSSFQLDGGGMGVQGFEPDAAVVLNLTQDHLDWHGSMEAYAAAKARVFGSHGAMVLNRDDLLVAAMEPKPEVVKGKARPVPVERAIIHFGLDAPQRPGDFGLVHEGGMAWLVRALPEEQEHGRKKGWIPDPEDLHLQRLMPADALRIRGRHNAANALAALALTTAIGLPLAPMLHGLREYAGEPHRVAFIASVGDVEAFDDSKGTNVGATVAALNGLGADKAPGKIVVILGGDGKGQDFSPLAEPVLRHVRAVALIGRDAPAIEQALAKTGVPMQRHDSLEAATAWCFAQAQASDAVLLSPACASLDMFRNYAHRAEVFVAAVQQHAQAQGELV
jgi:UDP-N-acetylmuramoylalanine--D-glutamate ligase